MDFTKFLSFIDRQALFFTKVDQLEDKFEGSISSYVFNPEIEERATEEEKNQLERFRKGSATLYETQRKKMAINIWHMNEHESAAMWKLYLKSEEGIAIQSTYHKLINSFYDSDEYILWIGMVKYIDYNKEVIPRDNLLHPYIYKRKSFEHERELRAVITKITKVRDSKGKPGKALTLADISESGVYVRVKVLDLIETIYVAPTCEKWFEDLIKSVLEKYKIEKRVIRSSLFDNPLY